MTAKASPRTGSAGTMRPPVGVVITPSLARAGEQVHADEVGDVAGTGLGGDVGERSGLDHPAGFEDDHPVGQGIGVDGVVGDEQPDPVEGGQVTAEVAAHVAAGADVEGGQRFVEQQQPWLGGQGPGERDALGLTAGQGSRAVAGVVGEPDPLEPGRGVGAGLDLGDAAGAQTEGDVLQRGQVGEQQVVLEDDGDRSLLGDHEGVGGRFVEDLAVELDAPLVDRQQPGQTAEHSALAGPVGSEHGDGLAALGGQVDVQPEPAERAVDACSQRHAVGAVARPPPRKRSRRPTRTPKDTAISTRLNTIASSGLTSFLR